MARAKYSSIALTHNGLPVSIVPFAEVSVYDAGTLDGFLPPLYVGPTGGTTLGNPFNADADGNFAFYVDVAVDVKLVITGTGLGTLTLDYERVLPPVSDMIFSGMDSFIEFAGGLSVLRDDVDEWALTVQQENVVTGRSFLIKSPEGVNSLYMTRSSYADEDILVLGYPTNTVIEAGGVFGCRMFVYKSLDDAEVGYSMLKLEIDATSDGDYGALGAVVRATVSGSPFFRAIEGHAVGMNAATPLFLWATEFGVHSEMVGDGLGKTICIFAYSDDNFMGGPGSSDGVESDVGLWLGGNLGFTLPIRVVARNLTTTLFSISQGPSETGQVNTKNIVPLADSAHNLGNGVNNWQIVYSDFLLLGDGGAAGPAHTYLADTTTGRFRSASPLGEGVTVGGVQKSLQKAATLQLETDLTVKQIAEPSAPASTYSEIWVDSTDQNVYVKNSAGIVKGVAINDRDLLIAQLLDILGGSTGDPVLIWTPKSTDAGTSIEESALGATITHNTSIAARLSRLGLGYGASYASASAQFSSTPDQPWFSFSNAGVDTGFSGGVLSNVTNTALGRTLIAKSNTGQVEYQFFVTTADTLRLTLTDQSAGVTSLKSSDNPITMGAPTLFGWSYSGGTGTASAANILLYQNAVSLTSTPTGNAGYGSMDPGTALVELGSTTGGTVQNLDGIEYLAWLTPKVMSGSDHLRIKKLMNWYFGLSL